MEHYKCVLDYLEIWGISESHFLAYCSTLLISIAPFLLLFLISFENKPEHQNMLRLALSFASGGLLGDAFLHLIPHSMGHSSHGEAHCHGKAHKEHDHDHHHHDHHDHDHDHHSHDHDHHSHEHGHHDEGGHHAHTELSNVGLFIILGIVLFFLIEKLLRSMNGDGGHTHSHLKISSSEDSDVDSRKLVKKSKKLKKNKPKEQDSHINKISGVLNLIADFLHNFTDGLAIGATFAAGKGMGSITAFTILFHEIPHEIGDYAILIQTGYKRSSALGLQLVTAIGALLGTTVGLYYGTLEDATQFILPITAGGFIYIATVSVLPELMMKKISNRQSFFEAIALGVGISMMYWIALYE